MESGHFHAIWGKILSHRMSLYPFDNPSLGRIAVNGDGERSAHVHTMNRPGKKQDLWRSLSYHRRCVSSECFDPRVSAIQDSVLRGPRSHVLPHFRHRRASVHSPLRCCLYHLSRLLRMFFALVTGQVISCNHVRDGRLAPVFATKTKARSWCCCRDARLLCDSNDESKTRLP